MAKGQNRCHPCDLTFLTVIDLVDHVNAVHTDEGAPLDFSSIVPSTIQEIEVT